MANLGVAITGIIMKIGLHKGHRYRWSTLKTRKFILHYAVGYNVRC